MDTLGKKIALYRHMRQWTQERLAFEVSITQSTLSDIENDKSSPTLKLILEIARALDVSLLQLLPQEALGLPAGQVQNLLTPSRNGQESVHAQSTETWKLLIMAKEELIHAKDELIRAKNEQIRELRTKLQKLQPIPVQSDC